MAAPAMNRATHHRDPRRPRLEGFFAPTMCPWCVVSAAGVLLCEATVTGFLGRFWWLLDLTSHFRVQYAVLLAGVALAMLLPRRYGHSLAFAGFSLVNLATVVPLYFGGSDGTAEAGRTVRVMLANVNTANTDYEGVRGIMRVAQPQIGPDMGSDHSPVVVDLTLP